MFYNYMYIMKLNIYLNIEVISRVLPLLTVYDNINNC